jgi:uncharacterized membrane protein YsdA (DUF1294 family)
MKLGRIRLPRRSYVVLAAFLGLLAVAAGLWGVPAWVFSLYGVASLAAAATYAVDKSAARGGRRRVPESTLLTLGLLGGWPGAIVAQEYLRHKTSKASFRVRFWLTVALNVAAFVLLVTPLGRRVRGA